MKKIIYGFLGFFLMIGFVNVSSIALAEGEDIPGATPSPGAGGEASDPSPVETPASAPTSAATSITKKDLEKEMERINIEEDKAMTAGKGALIGGAAGLAAGGVATAITAFVEHNRISCMIGNNLEKVGFGKSGKIKTLKEYYVQWNLRLPDTVMFENHAADCTGWETECNKNKTNVCEMVVANYKPANGSLVQIQNACRISGATCVTNQVVAYSNGACQ
jgi:hypothetical protein